MSNVTINHSVDLREPYKLQVKKRVNGAADDELTACYFPLRKDSKDSLRDVSSAIGLFTDAIQKISKEDNERIERCLADLQMCLIYPHFREPGSSVLVEGPPLRKLIGRVAYRHPSPDVTIAFVTVDPRFLSPPVGTACPTSLWDGPFPGLQDDNIVRIFYYRTCDRIVRVDLFAQGLAQYSSDERRNDIPIGVVAKLQVISGLALDFAQSLPTVSQTNLEPVAPTSLYDNTGQQPEEALVARQSLPKTTAPEIPIPADTRQARFPLTDEEIYDAILGDRKNKTGEARFRSIVNFFTSDGITDPNKKVELLRSLKKALNTGAVSRTKLLRLSDLRRIFRQLDEQESP